MLQHLGDDAEVASRFTRLAGSLAATARCLGQGQACNQVARARPIASMRPGFNELEQNY